MENGLHLRKVAFVANTSWSIYNFRLGIIRKLKSLGIKVVVVAPKDQFSAKLVSEGVDFENLYLDCYGTNPLTDLRTFLSLIKIYKQNKFDFIFHYTIKPNIYGSLAARLCGIPCFSVITGLGKLFMYNNWVLKKFISLIYKIGVRKCQEVWFLNQDDLQTFLELKIVQVSSTFVLHSEGINTRKFYPTNFDLPSGPLKFLYVGRILWQKGIGEYVEAAKKLKEYHKDSIKFGILGFIDPENPDTVPANFISKWQKQGIINYLGETIDVRKYMDEADCIVLPSYREGMSRVLLEAGALGKPIITTDQVGCRDIVKHGVNGLLCQPKDAEDLKRKIEDFIYLPIEEKFRMGRAGRKKVLMEFDEQIIIKKYLEKLGITHQVMENYDTFS